MKTSRRDFLTAVTASAATMCAFRFPGSNVPRLPAVRDLRCAILDLKASCVLRESLLGYQAALANKNYFTDAITDSQLRPSLVIVPALGLMTPTFAQKLLQLLAGGTHLLLESGGAFLSPPDFAAQQRILHRYFDLTVESPVNLWLRNSQDDLPSSHWPARQARKNPPRLEPTSYVNYIWPCETKVRDFSRAIPVSANVGDVIAKIGAVPVALKKRMSNGTLIFLGSPLGPALRAGDPEARSWLQLVTTF